MQETRKLEQVYKESTTLLRLEHPNIIALKNGFMLDRYFVLIMEYAGGGSLGDYLRTRGALPEFEARIIARQLLEAMQYYVSKHVVHRDLKPANILFQSETNRSIKVTSSAELSR